MPFGIRRQDCRASNNTKGQYVVFRKDLGTGVSCHMTREKAVQAAIIRIQNSKDLTAAEKRRDIESMRA